MIIGPRPDTPEALNIYKNDQVRKLEVKPGITGYNQAFSEILSLKIINLKMMFTM